MRRRQDVNARRTSKSTLVDDAAARLEGKVTQSRGKQGQQARLAGEATQLRGRQGRKDDKAIQLKHRQGRNA